MRSLDEHVLNEIFSFFPELFKFKTLQFLAKDYRDFVWNCQFNGRLELDFDASSCSIPLALLNARRGSEHTLFARGAIWSRLRHLRLVGQTEFSPALLELIVGANIETLERIELIRANSETVSSLLGLVGESSCLRSISICEAELESVHELDVFSIPSLQELRLNELFLIKDQSVLTISPPSRAVSRDELVVVEELPQQTTHGLERLELYLLPFSELLNFLKLSFSTHRFPNLSVLKIRCLSNVAHADQLASVLSAKVGDGGLPALADLDVGILTERLLNSVEAVCGQAGLRRLSFASRLEIDVATDLLGFAQQFPDVEELTVRVKHSEQLAALAAVVADSNWKQSLKKLKLTWSVINSISAEALVALRAAVAEARRVHAAQRSFVIESRTKSAPAIVNPFERFFVELCRDRIVCECDECAYGDVDESHILDLAQEEWDALEESQRMEFAI